VQFAIPVVLPQILFLAKELLVDPHMTWFCRDLPDDAISGASHPAQVTLEDRVPSLVCDLDRAWVRAGDQVRLTLYWQALQALEENYVAIVHLDASPSGITFLAADTSPPGDVQAQIDIPTTRWELDSCVRDEHRFEVPADLTPVRYTLRAGLYDPATGDGLGEAIELQRIQVLPGRPTRQSQVSSREEFRPGEHIELVGYEFEAGPGPALTLYWRTTERIEQDYAVFVHLLDGHCGMLGQGDGLPLGGIYPTQVW
jgi:hypothetical protein